MSKNSLPDFNNTELAFRHLSDKDLSRGKMLFQLLSRPWLVKLGSVLARIALFVKFPIGWAVRPTVYAQFCGGEDISDSEETIELLYRSGVRTILDYSAEGVDTEKVSDEDGFTDSEENLVETDPEDPDDFPTRDQVNEALAELEAKLSGE